VEVAEAVALKLRLLDPTVVAQAVVLVVFIM
jgi:hypothetical protein